MQEEFALEMKSAVNPVEKMMILVSFINSKILVKQGSRI